MGYTEVTKNGVTTRTYSDGKTEQYSTYGQDIGGTRVEAGEKVSTTKQGQIVVHRSDPSYTTGRHVLTPQELELEQRRIQEEIEQYGYYTPLQVDEQGRYSQTAPELSPSKYLQPPESAEGRKIISRHPAGEAAYEPSANWETPTSAKRKLESKIASGEYTTRNIGYKTEVGVKGEGGVAYYGDDVILGQLIQKKEPKGIGVSPKQKELQTGSLIADMVFEGYVLPPKTTEKGFELEFTEAGQQVKPYLLEKLGQTLPEDWMVMGTSGKLVFSGKPKYVETREYAYSVDASPLASKAKGSDFVSNALIYASGVQPSEQKQEENGFYSTISGLDKIIEGSPLGAFTNIGKEISKNLQAQQVPIAGHPIVTKTGEYWFETPEMLAKIGARAGTILYSYGVGGKTKVEAQTAQYALGAGIGVAALAYGSSFISNPLETAAGSTKYIVYEGVPALLAGSAWAGAIEGSTRMVSSQLSKVRGVTYYGTQTPYEGAMSSYDVSGRIETWGGPKYFTSEGRIIAPTENQAVYLGTSQLGKMTSAEGGYIQTSAQLTDDILARQYQISESAGMGYALQKPGDFVIAGMKGGKLEMLAAGRGVQPIPQASVGFVSQLNADEISIMGVGRESYGYVGTGFYTGGKFPVKGVVEVVPKTGATKFSTLALRETPMVPSGGGMAMKTAQIFSPSPQLSSLLSGMQASQVSRAVATASPFAAVVGATPAASALTKTQTKQMQIVVPRISETQIRITKTKTTPAISPAQMEAQITRLSTSPSVVPRMVMLETVMPRTATRPKIVPKTVPLMADVVLPRGAIVPAVGVIAVPATATAVLMATSPVSLPKTMAIPETAFATPKLPFIPIGFTGADKKSSLTKRKLPTKYKPSLLGVVTNVRIPKAPKFVSGAEWARGIVIGKKKGKKKKRRK
jgi:hypothetical protein